MKIAGLVKSSLIDYPGKVAAVVFTQGCNFRCGFCHNPDLIPMDGGQRVGEDEFFEFLKGRMGKLDGVVVTGGEPTLQPDLAEFLNKIKKMGFNIKLDSNGSNPTVLRSLISDRLVDYVAMDIKGSPEEYQKICGYGNLEAIKKSIDLIMNSGVDYEFRTTTLPFFHKISDFREIGKLINGAKRYAIQGFRSEITLDKSLHSAKPFTHEDLEKISETVKPYVKEVLIRENS